MVSPTLAYSIAYKVVSLDTFVTSISPTIVSYYFLQPFQVFPYIMTQNLQKSICRCLAVSGL